MPWRYQRRVKVGPGMTLNLGKTGASVSLGPKGAHTTLGHGRIRRSLKVPGVPGLYYSTTTRTSLDGEAPADSEQQPTAGNRAGTLPYIVSIAAAIAVAWFASTSTAATSSPIAFSSALIASVLVALVVGWLWAHHHLLVITAMALGLVLTVAAAAVALVVGILSMALTPSRRR